MARETQVLKIIRYMASNPQKEWWYAPDFQKQGMPSEYYVGYEATARISDIIREYPYLMEVKREGRFRYIKLREDYDKSSSLPIEIKSMIRQERTGQRELF